MYLGFSISIYQKKTKKLFRKATPKLLIGFRFRSWNYLSFVFKSPIKEWWSILFTLQFTCYQSLYYWDLEEVQLIARRVLFLRVFFFIVFFLCKQEISLSFLICFSFSATKPKLKKIKWMVNQESSSFSLFDWSPVVVLLATRTWPSDWISMRSHCRGDPL